MTPEDFDGIFSSLANDDFAAELNKEAKELFRIAEKSNHFKSAVSQWIGKALSSITLGGVTPKPVAMMVLVSFLLGQRFPRRDVPGLPSPEDIPLSPEVMEELRREIESAHRSTDEHKTDDAG